MLTRRSFFANRGNRYGSVDASPAAPSSVSADDEPSASEPRLSTLAGSYAASGCWTRSGSHTTGSSGRSGTASTSASGSGTGAARAGKNGRAWSGRPLSLEHAPNGELVLERTGSVSGACIGAWQRVRQQEQSAIAGAGV
jgi:hypothetical protein